MTGGRRTVIFALAVSALLGAFPHPTLNFESSNELSSLYLAHAIAQRGDFMITREIKRFGDITDKSERNGSFYSDKAPGAAWLAVLPALILRPFNAGDARLSRDQLLGFTRVVAVVFPALLFMFFIGIGFNGVNPLRAFGDDQATPGSFVYLLCTPAWIYSTMLYGHQLAAVALFASWLLVFDEKTIPEKKRAFSTFFAGLLAAYAIACDYPAIWLSACVSGYAVVKGTGKRPLFWVGFAIPIALLMVYHSIAFGGPFTTGYSFKSFAKDALVHQQGFLGISFPSLTILYGILLSPKRGLFFFSPVLAFAIIGIVRMASKKDMRTETIAIIAAVIGHALIIGGFNDWTAGWSYGPRHLVPMIPFLLPPLIVEMKESGRIERIVLIATIAISVVNTTLATVTFPHVPVALDNPLTDLFLTLIRNGNAGPLIGGLRFAPSLVFAIAVVAALIAYIALSLARDDGRKMTAALATVAVAAAATWILIFSSMKSQEGVGKHYAMSQVYGALGDMNNEERELVPLTLPQDSDDVRIYALYKLWKIAENRGDPRMALNWRRMYLELTAKKEGRPVKTAP